jgi:hypothetical protein
MKAPFSALSALDRDGGPAAEGNASAAALPVEVRLGAPARKWLEKTIFSMAGGLI